MEEAQEHDTITIEDILENDLVAREIFKHLTLSDLSNCSLVSQFWNSLSRAYIRDYSICGAKLPRRPSPCTSLAALESDLEQMSIIPYNGLVIYVTRCLAHVTSASCRDAIDQLFPNILNRINLKHLALCLENSKGYMCWLALNLVEKLLRNNSATVKHLSLTSLGYNRDQDLVNLIRADGFKNLKTLEVNWNYFTDQESGFEKFLQSCPSLCEIITPSVEQVPVPARHLIKRVVVNGSGRRWFDERGFEFVKAKRLLAFHCHFREYSWFRTAHVVEKLIRNGTESLEMLVIRGPEFPRWSQTDLPVLVNLQYLELVFSMQDPHLLEELNHLTGKMMPNLRVLHLYHSPCNVGHIVEPIEDRSLVVPNRNVKVLKIESFDLEMGTLMTEFKAYFPEVKELHVVDCDGSTFGHVFQWQLECVVAGAVTKYWCDNFDHLLLGPEPFDAEGGSLSSSRNTLDRSKFSVWQGLRKLYVLGGTEKPDSNAFLSESAASKLLEGSNIVLKVLPGYNKSVLEHLLPLDNSSDHPWCPSFPFKIEDYFKFS